MKKLCILLMLLALSGCASERLGNYAIEQIGGGPVDGVVLDQTTPRPIAGAIVVATWGTGTLTLDERLACYHVETALTDVEGRYHIPAWQSTDFRIPSLITEWFLDLGVYRAGFHLGDRYSERLGFVYPKPFEGPPRAIQLIQRRPRHGPFYLTPFKGTQRERMAELVRMARRFSCIQGDRSKRNRLVLYRALYEEGRYVAETIEDFDYVWSWRGIAEGQPR